MSFLNISDLKSAVAFARFSQQGLKNTAKLLKLIAFDKLSIFMVSSYLGKLETSLKITLKKKSIL